MKRVLTVAIYALGGVGIALSLSFATFALAGQELSDPANMVQPIAALVPGASNSPDPGGKPGEHPTSTHPPRPGTLSPAPASGSPGGTSSGGSSSGGSSPTPSPDRAGQGSGTPSPSPSHGGDDGSGGGDD